MLIFLGVYTSEILTGLCSMMSQRKDWTKIHIKIRSKWATGWGLRTRQSIVLKTQDWKHHNSHQLTQEPTVPIRSRSLSRDPCCLLPSVTLHPILWLYTHLFSRRTVQKDFQWLAAFVCFRLFAFLYLPPCCSDPKSDRCVQVVLDSNPAYRLVTQGWFWHNEFAKRWL